MLVVQPRGFHKEQWPGCAQRKYSAARCERVVRTWKRGVDVGGAQLMQAVGICVGQRYRGIPRQLSFKASSRLHDVRGAHRAVDFLNSLRRDFASKGSERRDIREEIRIAGDILLLRDAVETPSLENVDRGKAVVEDAESQPDNALGPRIPGLRSGSPRDPEARRKVAPVVYVGLRFITHA